jgi:hypothetical protein
MATYCANCGTQIKPGGKFCQACGTPVGQAASATEAATLSLPHSPSAQPPPAGAYPAPAYGAQPMGAPARKSSGVLKAVLITLTVLVVLGIGSVIGLYMLVRKAAEQVSIQGGQDGQAELSINTPDGKVSLSAKGEVSAQQLGVPIYPGAKADKGSGSLTFSGPGGKSGFIGTATFTTPDSVEEVTAFYKGKLGPQASVVETRSESKHSVVLKVAQEASWKMIAITEGDEGDTKITITSLPGKPSP